MLTSEMLCLCNNSSCENLEYLCDQLKNLQHVVNTLGGNFCLDRLLDRFDREAVVPTEWSGFLATVLRTDNSLIPRLTLYDDTHGRPLARYTPCCRIIHRVLNWLSRKGFTVAFYIDDFVISHPTPQSVSN